MNPEDRAWEVVRRAFEEREPRRRDRRPAALVSALAVAAVVAAVLTPAGQAVFDRVRQAVGVEHAAPALASLPGGGRLVVSAPTGGTWIVDGDGAKRALGDWTDAAWSPHGLFVALVSPSGLAAATPQGDIRWSLPRRGVAAPVWEGTRTDTRIAYFAAGGLRVVAGDGTGDRSLAPAARPGSAAWRPGAGDELAFARSRRLILERTDDRHVVWTHALATAPHAVAWSSDGARVAVVSAHRVLVLDGRGRSVETISWLGEIRALAFRPGTHEAAVTIRRSGRSEVRLVDVDRRGSSRLLFAGPGRFGDTAWSPGGVWLLVDWPTADQWLFVSPGARPRVRAVANVGRQFPRPDGDVPSLALANGWCCATAP